MSVAYSSRAAFSANTPPIAKCAVAPPRSDSRHRMGFPHADDHTVLLTEKRVLQHSKFECSASAMGQQHALGSQVQRFRFTPNSRPYLKLIDWPQRAAKSGCEQLQQGSPFAVGTRVTSRPPHRSVRAAFPHTAPTSGSDGGTSPYAFQRL